MESKRRVAIGRRGWTRREHAESAGMRRRERAKQQRVNRREEDGVKGASSDGWWGAGELD